MCDQDKSSYFVQEQKTFFKISHIHTNVCSTIKYKISGWVQGNMRVLLYHILHHCTYFFTNLSPCLSSSMVLQTQYQICRFPRYISYILSHFCMLCCLFIFCIVGKNHIMHKRGFQACNGFLFALIIWRIVTHD